jgi:enoyl-CoA hydratase
VSAVRVERDGGLATVVVGKPPLNLYDREVFDGLKAALQDLYADLPRAVLVVHEGRAVSGGVDVHEFEHLTPEDAERLARELLEVAQGFEDLPLPTVFAAHALCLTAAFELAMSCDILLASEKAKFGLVEKVVGVTPFMGGTQRFAERAGPARAKEFVYTAQLYDAATLERWNVVNRVLPVEGFEEAARAFATDLAEGPTKAHAATKEVVRTAMAEGVRAADERVAVLAGELFGTEDNRNAVRSFLDEGPGKATYIGR